MYVIYHSSSTYYGPYAPSNNQNYMFSDRSLGNVNDDDQYYVDSSAESGSGAGYEPYSQWLASLSATST